MGGGDVRFCFGGLCTVVGSAGTTVSIYPAQTNKATAWPVPLKGKCIGNRSHIDKAKREQNKQTDSG